ncbi:MAG TPA: PilZ domain-containing protein [Nitrospirota bacterium]|nr:PilZ domain-containing protein [Nitrospirota bacterium]
MSLHPGDQVCYRFMPEILRYTAVVESDDDHTVMLRLSDEMPPSLGSGGYLMITEPETDAEHYMEVIARDGYRLDLKRLWTGKRGYFRVDDAFPVLCRKVPREAPQTASKLFSGYGGELEDLNVPDETVSPRLWKMLSDMNAKLGLILERLNLEQEGLGRAANLAVNISASGIRIPLSEHADIGDLMELKMLLPVYPPVGILVHGTVLRVEEQEQGLYRTSMQFIDLADEVRDVIIQYTLKRQRELIRRQRNRGED